MKLLYSNILLLSIIPLLFISVLIKNLSIKPVIQISKEESSFTMNKELLYYFSMGNRRLISSFLWSYTLLESDIEHFKSKDGNSWMFNRFNTIALLDKFFYENYLFGGQYLSIIKDDVKGAQKIFELGLHEYPSDFWLNFYSGINNYFELDNPLSAYENFRNIKSHILVKKHAPFLPSLTSKIKAGLGGLKEAYLILRSTLKVEKNIIFIKRYQKQLYAIKAEIDTKCLNLGLANCEYSDFKSQLYILENGIYRSKDTWEPFRINKKWRAK